MGEAAGAFAFQSSLTDSLLSGVGKVLFPSPDAGGLGLLSWQERVICASVFFAGRWPFLFL